MPGQPHSANEASVFRATERHGRRSCERCRHAAAGVLHGISQINSFNDLLQRQANDPFFLEFDNGYVEVSPIFISRARRAHRPQVVVWGTSDLFNPTNNLNPRDFYDPLLFGKSMGFTEMLNFKYSTPFDLSIQAIYVPVFRPARLPTEAPTADIQHNGGVPSGQREGRCGGVWPAHRFSKQLVHCQHLRPATATAHRPRSVMEMRL